MLRLIIGSALGKAQPEGSSSVCTVCQLNVKYNCERKIEHDFPTVKNVELIK